MGKAPAVGPVVLTVSVAGIPAVVELGLIEHFGASNGNGSTEQERATAELKPPAVVTFTVAVDDPPGLTVPGVSGEAVTVKSGVAMIVMETVALADFEGSVTLVAVTVALLLVVTAGAV